MGVTSSRGGHVLESEFKRVLGTAQSAVGLLVRSTIAPEPPAYGIVYQSLAAGADTPDPAALDRANGQPVQASAQAFERADLLSAGIDALGETVDTASAANASFDASLSAAAQGLDPAAIDAAALRELFNRLITETERATAANRVLLGQLDTARSQLGALRDEIEDARHHASQDALTAIANRGHFDQSVQSMIDQAVASGEPLAMVLFDIDNFRRFNELFGHQAGDAVLRRVAGILTGLVRPGDVIARFGGEEFVALLRNADVPGAESFVARFRHALSRLPAAGEGSDPVTASYGIAALAPGDTPTTLIERADQCLYAAKQSGRDRIITDLTPHPTPDLTTADEGQSLLDLLADI